MLDITGNRYGKLVVLNPDHKDKRGEWKWFCKCDCGNQTIVYGSHLRKGDTNSCGCIMRNTNKKHGFSKTRLYKTWVHIKSRCNNPKNDHYKDYGGRGIKICNDWSNFEIFKEWALSSGYSDALTIERIDVNGNYEPNNCCWIPQSIQAQNTRKSKQVTMFGETHCIREWSRILNIPNETLRARINRGEEIYDTRNNIS